jgi:acetylornithine deacetylase/succinyl-diaminopimelate desuccinylase-like protein
VKKVGNPLPIDWPAVEHEAAQLLSRYIQFDTTNPPGNEAAAIEFLADFLSERKFNPHVIESAPGRANLVVRLPGQGRLDAAPCLLYAHADVVPAEGPSWSYPPFGGYIQDGFVWGRGALDDKALGVIFIQALILLKQFSPPLNRDIILLIAADEENCGRQGVAWLLDHHPALIKAGYVWDEGGIGLPHPADAGRSLYAVAVAEKGSLTVKLAASGTSGHASIPRGDSPANRLVEVLARLKRWQRPLRLTETVRGMLQALAPSQPFPRSFLFARAGSSLLWPLLRAQLRRDSLFSPLIESTVSLTMLHSGQKSNVLPARAEAVLDIRLLPGEEPEAVIADLRSFVGDTSVSVQVEDMPMSHSPSSTQTDFYYALAQTLTAVDPSGLVIPYLTPGTTDSRFFRRAGMQAYGFVPMLLNAQELGRIHGVDERVSTANLRWGIQVVFQTLQRL